MLKTLSAALLVTALAGGYQASAQAPPSEGNVPTQILVRADDKPDLQSPPEGLTVELNGHKQPVSGWAPLSAGNAQVAILLDDGLRESVGRELENLRQFVRALPPQVEVMVGYMRYGSVQSDTSFTRDHATAAASLRLPAGLPGASASPYMCISDFVKHWPQTESDAHSPALTSAAVGKARLILMMSNGVDPYNGSTSVMNQDSPYVDGAITDVQRAGVSVYSIYFGDAGIRGGSANNSGQSYLNELTQASGGVNFWQGSGNPVSTAPYLDKFQKALRETYVATFNAPMHGKRAELLRTKLSAPGVKLHTPQSVTPGNVE